MQIENSERQQPVLADKAKELQCRAFGSRPPALISWWRNGERLDSARSAAIEAEANASSSTLTFVPQLTDSGRVLSCRAENPALGGAVMEDQVRLEVHYLPRVKLALGEKLNELGQIREAHDVYFECSVEAQPAAHEIRWWFEGRELESNVQAGVIVSNQSLVLQHVNRRQRGRYTCSAINSVGESQSNSVHLRVQYAPFCRDQRAPAPEGPPVGGEWPFGAISQQRHKSLYGAARLEPVRVFCHVDADPADSIAYRWAFVATNGSAAGKLEFAGQQLVYLDAAAVGRADLEDPLVSVATYTPRSELDYGTLLCWAQNALGQQAEPCAYQIVPAERPDPVRNCRLVNASDTQLSVACEPGYDGGIEQSFQMEVYDSRKHELVANVSADANATSWRLPEVAAGERAIARQQKQRHSQQLQAGAASAAATAAASQQPLEAKLEISQQPQVQLEPETVFVTQANLRPATDYFLSIYSINSKGASKPVAFTATTMNLSALQLDAQLEARRTGK